jgi:hypothetical protein
MDRVFETLGWLAAGSVVAWAIVVERRTYTCESPVDNVWGWGVPLLVGLSAFTAIVSLCNCLGCLLRTLGVGRLFIGGAVSTGAFVLFAGYGDQLPACAAIDPQTLVTLGVLSGVAIVFFIAAGITWKRVENE